MKLYKKWEELMNQKYFEALSKLQEKNCKDTFYSDREKAFYKYFGKKKRSFESKDTTLERRRLKAFAYHERRKKGGSFDIELEKLYKEELARDLEINNHYYEILSGLIK